MHLREVKGEYPDECVEGRQRLASSWGFAAKLGAEHRPNPRRGDSVGKARVRRGSKFGPGVHGPSPRCSTVLPLLVSWPWAPLPFGAAPANSWAELMWQQRRRQRWALVHEKHKQHGSSPCLMDPGVWAIPWSVAEWCELESLCFCFPGSNPGGQPRHWHHQLGHFCLCGGFLGPQRWWVSTMGPIL